MELFLSLASEKNDASSATISTYPCYAIMYIINASL